MVLLKLFSKKWIFFTVVVALMMALFVRLGFWQLDRYEQKRAYNALLAQRWAQEPFNLSREPLPADLKEMEYRRVTADGYFDYNHQIVLRGQVYRDTAGVVLVTPFVMDNGRAVLVARGWVPADRADPQFWPELEEPAEAPMIGLLRPSQMAPNGQPSVPADAAQREWYRIDIAAIQAQMPYPLEPVWIQQLPEPSRPIDRLPVREEPMALDATTHMSYAVQWFSFAVIAGFGYVMFVRFKERQAKQEQRSGDAAPLSVNEQSEKTSESPVEASTSAVSSKSAASSETVSSKVV
ncbi:SURF1 family protein [Caldilinea sp.]|jgi:surfeit locus 1 family protein|uniref:SURF1 family protein n=1 Tax=Caldilinea sp. TaxID=2293560 RepID=UPI001B130FF5|nr:SURF1 family protein [Caldilinea sp.]MBO9392767.1 SURF1 family protein [Caldilinea sp.]